MTSAMLMDAYRDEQPGIRIAYRTDGHLLNIRRMQTSTRVSRTTVHDLLFADDRALNTTTEEDMQSGMHLFAAGCANFGLTSSLAKTAFDQPQASVWNRHDIHKDIKLKMYKAVVSMTLHYGAETWTTDNNCIDAPPPMITDTILPPPPPAPITVTSTYLTASVATSDYRTPLPPPPPTVLATGNR
ncbi:unnamed protein product [Schistocephalus solidus]|uniref:Reverse transcriptase domain-containing protein n=1 Tax=Schistocephalus solidus TaxID=70667 RepID=A0A183T8S4_SCHSO|nr:unnamed protein product [Schistocephalus solidus]